MLTKALNSSLSFHHQLFQHMCAHKQNPNAPEANPKRSPNLQRVGVSSSFNKTNQQSNTGFSRVETTEPVKLLVQFYSASFF